MKRSPEELEKFIHRALRDLPPRRAPRSIEERVLATLAARAALPWWRQSFMHWPVLARIALLVTCTSVAALLLVAGFVVTAGFDLSQVSGFAVRQLELASSIRTAITSLLESTVVIYRMIPPLWIYSILALVGACYATLIGVGATAYRAFAVHR